MRFDRLAAGFVAAALAMTVVACGGDDNSAATRVRASRASP